MPLCTGKYGFFFFQAKFENLSSPGGNISLWETNAMDKPFLLTSVEMPLRCT